MCVSKNVYSRLHQIEEVNKLRGENSMSAVLAAMLKAWGPSMTSLNKN